MNKKDKPNKHSISSLEDDRSKFMFFDAPLPFQALDKNAKIININPAWTDLMGYNRDEVIGKEFSIFLEPKTRKSFIKEFEKIISTHIFPLIHYHLITKKGEHLTAECYGNLILDAKNNPYQTFCILFDITEKEKAEAELIKSQKEYFDLVHNATCLIQKISIDGKIQFVNPKWLNTLEYTLEEAKEMSIFQIVKQEDVPLVAKKFEKVNQGHLVDEFQTVFVSKSGREIFVEGTGKGVFENGKSVAVVGTFRDITDRKVLEEKLKEETRLLNKSQEIAHVGSWNLNLKTKKLTWSPEVYRILGIKPEQFKGTYESFLSFVHPEDRKNVDNAYAKSLQKHTHYDFTHRIIRPDGEIRYLREKSENIQNKEDIALLSYGIVQDVTDSVLAEKALNENLEYTKLLFDHSPDAMFLADLKGVFIDGNSAAEKLIGFKKEELIGKSFLKPGLLPITQISKAANQIKKIITHKHSKAYEITLIRKDKEQIIIESHAHLVKFKNKRYILGSARNITDRKKTEEALKISNEKLIALSKHKNQIREEERKIIALDLHDDLGQKLTAINMNLSWLQNHISIKNNKITNTIENLLSQIQEASSTLQKTATQLQPAVLRDLGLREAIIWQLKDFQNKTKINCQIEIGQFEQEPNEEIALQIFRMIQESLTNIMRHSNATVINFSFFITKRICFTIKDNGDGMSKKTIESIHSFGLNGIQERAKLCGGKASITSKKGLGTKIIVNLPLKEAVSHD